MSETQSTAARVDERVSRDAVVEELDADLSSAVSRLFRRLRAGKVDDQLSDSHRTVLALLVKEGPHTLRELSDHEHVKPPSMNQTVNLLVQSGYVERRDDPHDGRKVILVATAEGVALIAETSRRLHAWLQAQLRELSPDECQILSSASGIISRIANS